MGRALGQIVTAVLGVNVWASLLLVPAIHTQAFARLGAAAAMVLLAVPLAALAAGAALLHRTRASARAVLLGVFPTSLLVLPIADPAVVGPSAHGGATFVLTFVSFLAYGGAAAWLLSRVDAPALAARTTPLRDVGPDPRVAPRRRDLRLVLGLAAAVPAVVLVLPLARPGAEETVRTAFPGAAGPAMVGVAAVASALAAGVLLVYFAPMLRRATADVPREPSLRTRLGWTALVVALGIGAAAALVLRG